MLVSKISQFIKKRYFTASETTDGVLEEEVTKDAEKAEKAEDDVQEDEEIIPESEPQLAVEEVDERAPEEKAYEETNKGRVYGWWVYLDGHRVASLDYRHRLDEMVHLYSVNMLDEKLLNIDLDPAKWMEPDVTLQNRYAESYIKQGLIMVGVGQKLIAVEDLTLPEEHFRRQYTELKEFQQTLLENRSESY